MMRQRRAPVRAHVIPTMPPRGTRWGLGKAVGLLMTAALLFRFLANAHNKFWFCPSRLRDNGKIPRGFTRVVHMACVLPC